MHFRFFKSQKTTVLGLTQNCLTNFHKDKATINQFSIDIQHLRACENGDFKVLM